MKKELLIQLAIALVTEFMEKCYHGKLPRCTNAITDIGAGCDLLLSITKYIKYNEYLDDVVEYGALVTSIIDDVDTPIDTFMFVDRHNYDGLMGVSITK